MTHGVAAVGDRRKAACTNCQEELTGEFCSACGERRVGPEDLSAMRFLHDLADQVASFRFKFKTLRSLWTLVTPGLLTEDFLAGRRRPYLSPLRLYLICAAIFFVAAPWAGYTLEAMIAGDQTSGLSQIVSARIAALGMDRAHFSERFDLRVQTVYTICLGLGVVAMALLLQLLFRRRATPFGAHLVFALHFVSFEYLLTIPIGFSRQLKMPGDLAALIGLCLLAIYLGLAVKRVYRGSVPSTLMWAAALFVLTMAVNFAASLTAIRLTLLLV